MTGHTSKRANLAKRVSELPGGTGTFDDPLTFASSSSIFSQCEVIYFPYIQKYLRFEDDCTACDKDAANGIVHIDIWAGNATVSGGDVQVACENKLTPSGNEIIVRNPPSGLPVNSKLLCIDWKLHRI